MIRENMVVERSIFKGSIERSIAYIRAANACISNE